jgi:hypothetical protein
MIARTRLLFCLLLGCVTGDPALAQSWRLHDVEASVSNRANTSSLVVECISNGAIFMRIQFRVFTRVSIKDQAIARIGTKSFPLRVDSGNEYIFLSDRPDFGISAELIAALKGGGTIVFEGKALGHLPEAQRSFPLEGGAKPIEEVQRDCGRQAGR